MECFIIREEIKRYAVALEWVMRYNEGRGKTDEWKYLPLSHLHKRLAEEVKELDLEILPIKPDQKKVRHEALDVGALAFYIWYNSKLKDGEGLGNVNLSFP